MAKETSVTIKRSDASKLLQVIRGALNETKGLSDLGRKDELEDKFAELDSYLAEYKGVTLYAAGNPALG